MLQQPIEPTQFTGTPFTSVLKDAQVRISMDGRGRWMDNVFIERLWRSVKYEEVYLHAYENGRQARAGIGAYFEYYNTRRRHQGLAKRALPVLECVGAGFLGVAGPECR